MSQEGFHHALKVGYRIHWYTIDKVLGQGGFGITYLGHDNNLDQRVAIKEFLPSEFAVRGDDQSIRPVTSGQAEMYDWALDRFIAEARTLAKFDHPNIVRVMAVFEENNAAYMVMRYEEGDTLEQIFKTQGILSQDELLNIVLPIIDGLKSVHQAGFIHRDIKPANIFIRNDGSPVLIDFGSARQSIGAKTQTLTTLISPGYSPIEQYYTSGEDQGPWTDIYGLASTLYRGVAGKRPVDTMTRSKQIIAEQPDPYIPAQQVGQGRYNNSFLQAIDQGLEFRHQHRPQDLVIWQRQLLREDGEPREIGPDAPTMPAGDIMAETEAMQLLDAVTEVHTKQGSDEVPGELTTGKRWLWPVMLTGIIMLAGLLLIAVMKKQASPPVPGGEPSEPDVPATVVRPEPEPAPTKAPVRENIASSKTGRLLQLAEEDLRANRLTLPRGNNAFERYREVLQMEPENKQAKQGMRKVVTRKMTIIENAIKNRNFDHAQTHIDNMIDLLPDNRKLKRLDKLIRDAQKQQ